MKPNKSLTSASYDEAPSGRPAGRCLASSVKPLDRRLRVCTPVVVESDLAADDVVLFPAGRALGKSKLRLDDLLEHRVGGHVLLDDLVVDLELPAQDRIRSLEEPHLVLSLQRYVILR